MATQSDVRRIALSLPGTVEEEGRFAFSVEHGGKRKGIAWVWLERLDPKKARVPNPKVIGVRVAGQVEKELLLASDEDKFFTEPHYNGYPAVLVRLAAVGKAELEALITSAWRCQAPKALQGAQVPPAPKARPASKANARPANEAKPHPASRAKAPAKKARASAKAAR